MSHKHDEERLDRIISEAVDLGRVEFDRETWLARLAAKESQAKPKPHKNLWRTIMESRITKYSAAATILLAAALVLSDPFGLFGGRHGVLLAETVERMDQVRTITNKEKRIFYERGKDEPMLRADVVKYVAFDRGIVEEQYDEAGNLQARAYILKDPPEITIVLPLEKKYVKIPLADSWARLMNHLTPKAIVEHFKSGGCKDLGPATVDGYEVEGFETTSTGIFPIPESYRFLIKDIKWQFWLSRDQPFPVAADVEVTTGRGLLTVFKELRIACHDYDMVYDANLPATLFDPNIPADYTPLSVESTLKENAAWLGVGTLPAAGLVIHRRRRAQCHRTAV